MAANDVPCCEPMFWVYLLICVALVCFAGLMSGLTLGLMSLSLVDLEVLMKAGLPQDRKNAVSPRSFKFLAPTLQIIPQALCSRYGLRVGAKLSVLVRLIVIVLFPISYPISKLLDLLLGKRHSALLRRAELKTLVDMHGNEAGKGGELTHDETTIITGALDMTQKTAKDAMTPMSCIFSLDINSRLDEKTTGLIISKGHSRVPIYSGTPTNIIGLILVKNLIKYHPQDETLIRGLTIRRIPRVHDHLPLYDILNQFQKGHSHMAVVVKCKDAVKEISTAESTAKSKFNVFHSNPKPEIKELESLPNLDDEVIGIITLEDVMEELLQEEILDETDEYVDVRNKIKINMLPSQRSSSPGAAVASRQWSPLSSYNRTPLSSCNYTPAVLRSPVLPCIQSPFIRPTLSASPGKAMPNSPAKFSGTAVYSPSSQQVSRKSYVEAEKARG
ncbi:hypothetical protein JRO89_XS11G0205000 [Xanthoceras sorbifolium]|uniref:CNNM transmembrane domain-containing protein n=1 Tax=Xanthoceras sorbifolium TaxID=99658 RepID=A0ABQ8HGH9_9ROSI|nr:hypothetical protein JRO89_XS11G0205000 [Xanthoceras sorbifolium]